MGVCCIYSAFNGRHGLVANGTVRKNLFCVVLCCQARSKLKCCASPEPMDKTSLPLHL